MVGSKLVMSNPNFSTNKYILNRRLVCLLSLGIYFNLSSIVQSLKVPDLPKYKNQKEILNYRIASLLTVPNSNLICYFCVCHLFNRILYSLCVDVCTLIEVSFQVAIDKFSKFKFLTYRVLRAFGIIFLYSFS